MISPNKISFPSQGGD